MKKAMKWTAMKVATTTTAMKKATKTTAMKKDGQDVLKRVRKVEKQVEDESEVLFGLQHRVCKLEKQAEELQHLALQLRAQYPVRARQTPKQPAPPPKKLQFPWEMHYSLEHNIPYFWNSETGLAVWERPV